MTDLDTILSGSSQDAGHSAPAPEPTPGEPQRHFERESPDPAAAPSAPPTLEQEPPQVPVQALQDERRRRQAAEAELQRRMAAYEQHFAQQEAPRRPDVFENPDGAFDYVQQQFEQRLTRTRLDMSVAMAKTQYPDYETAEAAFVEAVHANPTLYEQMLQDPHPAGFAYRVGTQVQALRDIGGDPNAYRQKLRQEIEAEVRRELHQPERHQPPRSSIPPSLASARDSSGRFMPAWGGPPSLKEILAPKK
jgi:hypothetical protein